MPPGTSSSTSSPGCAWHALSDEHRRQGAPPRTSLAIANKSARFPVKCPPLVDSRSRPKRRGRATYANFSRGGVRERWRPFRVGMACAIFLSRASAPSSARVSPSEGVISWLL
jgi:hypothetical protein